MLYCEIIDHFGSLTKASRGLNVPVTTVSEWRRGVPFGMQCFVELVTEGNLRADRTGWPLQRTPAHTIHP